MFHQPFYSQSQQQQQQAPFHHNHGQNNYYMPPHSSFYCGSGPVPNQSSQHLNFSRIFEYFPMPSHGFNSMAKGNYAFNDLTHQQQWPPNMMRNQQQQHRRTPAYHFQDKSTYYYMSDPMINNNNRITVKYKYCFLLWKLFFCFYFFQIQLTKVHIGRNGDQQRVFVEQEFSNQSELKKFVKNLKHNFEKTFNNRATGTYSSNENITQNQHMNNKKAG